MSSLPNQNPSNSKPTPSTPNPKDTPQVDQPAKPFPLSQDPNQSSVNPPRPSPSKPNPVKPPPPPKPENTPKPNQPKPKKPGESSPAQGQPMVFQPSKGNRKKIILYGGLVLSTLLISLLTFVVLSFVNRPVETDQPTTSPPESQASLPSQVNMPARKGDFAITVNDQTFSWNKYEEFLEYSLKKAGSNVNDPQVRKKINQTLVEYLLLKDTVEKRNIQPSQEEIAEVEKKIFSSDGKPIPVSEAFKNNPQTKRIILTRAYKEKIIENLVDWVSGGYIMVELSGRRANMAAAKKNTTPDKLARQTIETYHQQAKNGADMENLVEQMKQDATILEINGSIAKEPLFEHYTRDQRQGQPSWEDPGFQKTVFSLSEGQTSNIFILRMPNNREKSVWTDYAYVFIKAEEVFDGAFQSYQDWLDQNLEKAKIVSNLQ